jgi:hypothetical protein
VFIGSNGPCKVSVNIGGKIFRSHNDEINRGLIDTSLKKTFKAPLKGAVEATRNSVNKGNLNARSNSNPRLSGSQNSRNNTPTRPRDSANASYGK